MNSPVPGDAVAPARIPATAPSSYPALLRVPGVLPAFASATVARLCYGVLGLPLLLTLRQGTGGYGTAGAAAALFGLTGAVLGPARARLAVRRPGALPVLAWAYALLLAGLAAACLRPDSLPVPALLGLAAVTGACAPPVGPLMRAAWAELTHRQPAARQRALSLDTASESAVFAGGPALAGGLVAVAGAPAVLLGVTVLVLVAFTCLAATLPAARPAPARETVAKAAPPSRGSARSGGLPGILLLAGASAAGLGLAELAVVAAWGAAAAGLLTALFSAGGVAGGLLYGSRAWPGDLPRRAVVLAASAACCYLLPATMGSPWVAAAALLLAGACADVLLVVAYERVETDELAPLQTRVAAGARVNTAFNLGAALGPALGGTLVDRSGPASGFAAAAALLLTAALPQALRPRRRR